MKKTIALALVAVGSVYLMWQTSDLKAQLVTMRTIGQQQSLSQQSLQQSINDLAETMQTNLRQLKPQSKEASPQSDDRLVDIENILSHLQEQINNLAENIEQNNQDSALLASDNAQQAHSDHEHSDEEHPAALTAEQIAKQKQAAQARIELIEHMVNDPSQYDAEWSPSTKLKLDNIIAEVPELKVAATTNSQCGSSICRVKATLPSSVSGEERDLFDFALVTSLAEELPSAMFISNTLPDGSQELTYYMVRAGSSFPQAEAHE